MTSSAPASRKWIRSSTSWVALTHMTGIADIDGVARISRQISTADLRAARDIDDDELVLDRLGERLVGIGRAGDRIAGMRQDRRDGLAGRGVRIEQEDGTGGQRALPGSGRCWVRVMCGIGQEDTTAVASAGRPLEGRNEHRARLPSCPFRSAPVAGNGAYPLEGVAQYAPL